MSEMLNEKSDGESYTYEKEKGRSKVRYLLPDQTNDKR